MRQRGVTFLPSTRATGFVTAAQRAGASGGPADAAAGSAGAEIAAVQCSMDDGEQLTLEADTVVFAVGAQALASMVRGAPELSCHAEWRRYSRLRGTSVLATRLYLDQTIKTPHTANACWGFDAGVGMTWFDIGRLHELEGEQGSVIEVDYYHAQTLLPMDDAALTAKAKADLDTMLGSTCRAAKVVDAAIVRLPAAVNWYYPGSYVDLPDLRSKSTRNAFFVGDLVKSRHGSWSQEKAYVVGLEAANAILGRPADHGIVPLDKDEPHVMAGRKAVGAVRGLLGEKTPSLADFSF